MKSSEKTKAEPAESREVIAIITSLEDGRHLESMSTKCLQACESCCFFCEVQICLAVLGYNRHRSCKILLDVYVETYSSPQEILEICMSGKKNNFNLTAIQTQTSRMCPR
jgi:hypothetical protein